MTEPEINQPVVESSNKYEQTFFKSSYWYGGQLVQLFCNYGVGGHDSFSFITKKGKLTLIHNMTKDEKLPFLRAAISRLTLDEKILLLKE